ncbi:MAG: ABC transporter ATP-binding protein [Burkholderiaceae bacterium]|nr:ABC transporter ATP-binding protein [Burkholderiaceae bacterium]
MLKVSGLGSGYGSIPILCDVNLQINEGEFLGVLGHNGMGKTTLLKTMMGILRAKDGTIAFKGTDITRAPTHQRVRMGMGYVPQGRGIFPGLTVTENLLFAQKAMPQSPKGFSLEAIVEEFPRLKPLLPRPGGALSGGEQQLLALARAIVPGPELLLLDEPTEGIQPSIIEEIVDKLKEIRSRLGITILVVEQNLDFIRHLSDRVLLIHKGSIERELQPSELSDGIAMGNFSEVQS